VNQVALSATVRTVAATLATVTAVALVEFALVGPDEIARLTPADFLRIPVDGLVAAAVVLALPGRPRLLMAAALGVLLGLLTVLKIVDMGFYVFLDRPFNPTSDWGYFRSASDLLSLAVGRRDANVSVVAAVVLATLVMVVVPLSVLWLTRVASRHRVASLRLVAALGAVSLVGAAIGVHVGSGQAMASTDAAGLLADEVRQIHAGLDDRQTLLREAADDPFRTTPRADLLTGLRGKDVVIAFVESYGKVAVQGSSFAPRVDALLRNGARRLQAAGFASRSAFLTSPTFGGISWLAHSTLQSGLWIDNQHTYDDLVTTPRFTLSDAFKRAGWRTVADVPSNEKDWPEGRSFYHYDQIYDDHNVGYHGPSFSYASMPDQYTLSALQRLELARPDRTPVMAEVDLVSSHIPWAPLPRMVDWRKIGDGSIFDAMPAQGQSPTWVWRSADRVRAAYGHSVEYSLRSLMSFVRTYPAKNLVLIVLGDHQPSTMVTGQGQSHDVPVSVIAHDPAVMRGISGWHWQSGMLPGANAPVWPMSSFRDRFLTAFDAEH
jgi:hypothetical protein